MAKKKIQLNLKKDEEIIGQNIRRIRQQKRFSQKEMAVGIEVAATQYSRVESGKVMPTLKTVLKIARMLEVSLDTIVNEDGAPAQEVSIQNKTLFDKVRLIDDLPESERNMILQVIDLALSKKKFKDLLQQIA